MSKFFTSKNLTIAGVLTILAALSVAGKAVFDGDPATVLNIDALWTEIVLGIAMIAAKGAATTGGSNPVTPEAVKRVGT